LSAVIRELLQPEIELPVMVHLSLHQELDWFPLSILADLAAAPIVPYNNNVTIVSIASQQHFQTCDDTSHTENSF
jgi:hypothetical protein